MKTLQITIQPLTAFATILKGDTLFGQLCWTIVHLFGEAKLNSLLAHYHQQPFVVISDPFPLGYLPKPLLPASIMGQDTIDASERKILKKKIWLSIADFEQAIEKWAQLAKTEQQIVPADASKQSLQLQQDQAHNTINRQSHTTGGGEFSPYQLQQIWYHPEIKLMLYIVLDEQQFTLNELEEAMNYCAACGYGKESSTGLGKFKVSEIKAQSWVKHEKPNAWLSLAPVVPQGLKWQAEKCYYQPFTRFGRHGDQLAVSGQPFKNPVLMAQTAAVLTPMEYREQDYTGSAVGGISRQFGQLSKALPETVHQGYAPILNIRLPSYTRDT